MRNQVCKEAVSLELWSCSEQLCPPETSISSQGPSGRASTHGSVGFPTLSLQPGQMYVSACTIRGPQTQAPSAGSGMGRQPGWSCRTQPQLSMRGVKAQFLGALVLTRRTKVWTLSAQ